MMIRRTPNGQVFIKGAGKDGTEIWSPEELVMGSSLENRLAGDDRIRLAVTECLSFPV